MDHINFLKKAAAEAHRSHADEMVIAGAVLVKGEAVIAQGYHRCQELNNPMATAEMECIRQAGRRSDQAGLVLYCSRYPDMLIAGTIVQFSIGSLVIGLPEKSNPAIDFLKLKNVPTAFIPTAECIEFEEKSW